MAILDEIGKFREDLSNAENSAMVFYSYVHMDRWNIPAILRKAYIESGGKDVDKFLTRVTHTASYVRLKAFFINMFNDVLGTCQKFAAGDDTVGLEYNSIWSDSGRLAGAIRGQMMEIESSPLFHFFIAADAGSHYRFVHFGIPKDWNDWVQKMKPTVPRGGPYEGKEIKVLTITENTGEKKFRVLMVDGESTELLTRMKPINPRPFIPDIMEKMWSDKYQSEFQTELMGKIIPQLIRDYGAQKWD